MIDWLLSPLSGATEHHIAAWASWHARCMVLAWGVLLPAGALAARYFKVLPGQDWPGTLDNKAWWHAHRLLQWTGVLAMTAGLGLAWGASHGGSGLAQWHRLAGWLLAALAWLQILGGLLRGSKGGPGDVRLRGDHYDMTPRRIWFERLHKSLGWLAVLASIFTILAGLRIADAPRWMPITLIAWWLLLGGLAWRWQRAGRCIDTYQAIWGPHPHHPGNHRLPIGWGITRPHHTHHG